MVVSHDIPDVFEISDAVAMMHDGLIVEQGPPDEFQKSQNPVVQQFLKGEVQGPIHV